MIIEYYPVDWEYNIQDVVALLHVIHMHGYLPNPKFSQAFEFANFYRGMNHELTSKYQFMSLFNFGYYVIRVCLFTFCFITQSFICLYMKIYFIDVNFY